MTFPLIKIPDFVVFIPPIMELSKNHAKGQDLFVRQPVF